MDEREANDRFLLLVEEFRLAGWIGLGKIKNPQAEDVRPDLGLARHAIDTLCMIEMKTRGNRTEGEDRLIRQTLADLRLNFADEVKRAQEAKPADPSAASPSGAAAAEGAGGGVVEKDGPPAAVGGS